MEITEKVTDSTLVRAGINEKKFFERMGHLFESSFSVLGELMQNARRAGATRIDFNIDAEMKSLSIQDDGHGITDFAALINLCDSAWAENVVLEDKPFGMGLFSVFYAGASVNFLSKGKNLSLSIDDVISKRLVAVVEDNAAPAMGAMVRINELNEKFLRPVDSYKTGERIVKLAAVQHIEQLSKGFPVPVFVNGIELERPHAENQMAFTLTDIGRVSIGGIHRDSGTPASVRYQPVQYLQGLPLGLLWSTTPDSNPIVHLDSVQFVAKMPDRNQLFDAHEQNEVIRKSLRSTAKQFLIAQKASLSPEQMVRLHWEDCALLGLLYLFNDISLVPKSLFETVCAVRISSDSYGVYEGTPHSGNVELVSRQDVIDGEIVPWMNAPDSADDGAWASVCLKVMQANGIKSLRGTIDEAHWLHDLLPSASDLDFTVTATGASEKAATFYSGNDGKSAEIRLCDSISVQVTSATDPAFARNYPVNNDWILVPVNPEEHGDFDDSFQAFVCRANNASDEPTEVLSSFLDEHDHYREDWADEDKAHWNQLLNNLNGAHLAATLKSAFSQCDVQFADSHMSQMALCTLGPVEGRPIAYPKLNVRAVDDGTFEALAHAIGVGVTATQIKLAFEAVFTPGATA
ncbi:hypothetical protein Rfer_4307 (plasmid) [Rhodoferax ferrireducens T118]|uniref:ATP-binding protein n=1 Tax=Albidiferax ferrireducens (strain ATCC BAA-621 / DSM 15236 / T118) TaxID=338969 RepID=Q21QF2_ALBFT|nr:ATP-binding protein [Rhodoferax ferrireducens]ABD71993.1 hypothetical protein Rfer_4307 [Rhodoferax ferrireducens T118]